MLLAYPLLGIWCTCGDYKKKIKEKVLKILGPEAKSTHTRKIDLRALKRNSGSLQPYPCYWTDFLLLAGGW